MKVLTKKAKFKAIILMPILFLLIFFSLVSYAQEVLIFPPDSRRDPVCFSDSMAYRAGAVANFFGGTAFLISPENHVLTAAHILPPDHWFWNDNENFGEELKFGIQARICGTGIDDLVSGPKVQLDKKDLIAIDYDLDYALFKVDYKHDTLKDVAVSDYGLGWLNLDPDTRLTQLAESEKGLYILAHNFEFERTMLSQDDQCKIVSVRRDCTHLMTRELPDITSGYAMKYGPFYPPENACLGHQCDSMQSNSGSPLLLNINSKVVGLMSGHMTGLCGPLGCAGDVEGIAVKIRQIYPAIREFLPTAEELADNDGDGMPNVRDNCPDVPNTGTCTAGKVGVINYLGHRDCDLSFPSQDGFCEGSQLDDDADGVGDACATLQTDGFEPNDLPSQAGVLTDPYHYELTIHDRMDTDFLKVTIPHATDYFSILAVYVTQNRELGKLLTYQDCDTCPSVFAPGTLEYTDSGWKYTEQGIIPAGRTYLLELSEAEERGPFEYTLRLRFGGEELPPDGNEPNNTEATATGFSGCDFTGLLNIHSSSDIDYYKIEASGYSVKAEISFDPSRGELELFLDDTEATELPDGTTKTLSITGCGQSPSYVKVQGVPNFYDICITKIPLQEGCPGYLTPNDLRGTGTFTYTEQVCGPTLPGEQPIEHTVSVKKQMYAVITSESPDEVFWSIAAWLEYPGGFTKPLVVELHCERGVEPHPAQVTMKILKPTLDGILWSGNGQGECYGSNNADILSGFSVTADLTSILYPFCVEPGHGTLTIEGYIDTDNDGIPDQVEIETGTDPNSDDTDGDGIPDGEEDANQNGQVDYLTEETDPRLWDSDGDGVSDGVEKGLTSPNANDTDSTIFQADQDPATTTDPNRQNTDGDCFSDGEEDANQNGRVDTGETSPIVQDNLNDLDCDGVPDDQDPCPNDPDNDLDGDGLCRDDDPCPDDSGNDADQDLFCQSSGDCDDADPEVKPGATEICGDTIDNNCNDQIDEGCAVQGDNDGDGDVDRDDVRHILTLRNQPASECPECDIDGDGMITVRDAMDCIKQCTRPRCARE